MDVPRLFGRSKVTVWIDLIKMVTISAVISLVLCIVAVLLAGISERSFLLFAPSPKWPVFLVFAVLWCVSMKAGYWWVFQRYTFYPPR